MVQTIEMKGNPADNARLRVWYDQLPLSERTRMRRAILAKCKVSVAKFHNWRHCDTRIEPLYRDMICEAIGRNIFDEGTDSATGHETLIKRIKRYVRRRRARRAVKRMINDMNHKNVKR